jgi:hypothetical protein
MKKLRYFIFICLLVTSIDTFSQQLTKFEYFFDTDPGLGKGISLTVNKQKVDTNYVLSVSTLANGLHTFFVRAIDSSGRWSLTTTSSFVKYSGVDTVLNIVAIEYFFDKDPGFGNGIPLVVTPGNTITNDFNITIPDNGLESRTLYIRAEDSYGRWTLLNSNQVSFCNLYKTTANFGYVRYGDNYSLIDSSTNNYFHNTIWRYDDGSVDSVINPLKKLSLGNHYVKLVAGYGCRADSIVKALFTGVESFDPKQAMAGGDFDLNIYGGNLDSTITVSLIDSSGKTIASAFTSYTFDKTKGRLQFDLHNNVLGAPQNWDIRVTVPKSNYDTIIKKALLVYPKPSDTTLLTPSLSITTNVPSNVQANQWYNGSYVVKNSGLVAAKIVPLGLAIDYQIQSFIFTDSIYTRSSLPDSIKSIPPYIIVDTTFGEPFKSKLYLVYLQEIGPGQTITIPFRFLAPNNPGSAALTLKFRAKMANRLFGSGLQKSGYDCLTGILGTALTVAGIATSGPVGLAIALTGLNVSLAQTIGDLQYDQNSQNPGQLQNLNGNILGAGLGAAGVPGTAIGGVAQTAGNIMFGVPSLIYGLFSTGTSCYDWFTNNDNKNVQDHESYDPNSIEATYDYDTTQHFYKPTKSLNYTIHFENSSNASKAASRVLLIDTLSKKMNFKSLKITGFTIEDSVYTVPDFRNQYTTTVNRISQSGVKVRFNAIIDTLRGILNVNFESLDPTTNNLVSDTTLLGFLQPHAGSQTGQGSVSFEITASVKDNLDTFSNKASIYFDYNVPIPTNTFINTIDSLPPTGKVLQYKLLSDSTFKLYFTSKDGESGVNGYDLFFSVNKGAYNYFGNIKSDSVKVFGLKDSLYDFYVIPVDNVGNRQVKAATSEISVPLFNTDSITGNNSVCVNSSVKLSTTAKNGKWISLNNSIASVDTSGNVTGVSAGSCIIGYTVTKLTVSDTVFKTILVLAIPPKPTITRDSTNALVSSAAAGNQWYTDTTAAINGATSQSYHPGVPNYYSVRVTQNGCSSLFSDKYYYLITAIVSVGGGNYINIAPNPTKDFIVIRHNLSGNNIINIELYDLNGKKMLSKNNVTNGERIAVSQLAGGMYILKIYNSGGKIIGSEKIIKL